MVWIHPQMRVADRYKFADPRNVGELAEPLRSRIYTAIADAPADGLALVSGYRTPWQQYLLRAERVGASLAFDRRYPGYPRTAIPYTSKHQQGLAADMGGRELAWLIANERRYGLARTVPSERWHFEPHGTPLVRIIPYPGGVGQQLEEFEMDAEAKAAFDKVNQQLNTLIGWAQRHEARIEELEVDRWKPTTKRVRELHENAGLSD